VTGSPNPKSYPGASPSSYYLAYHDQLETLKDNGGNYVRIINSPWSTDVEFHKLNNYSGNMAQAWEMDEILRVAEELDLKIHFDLQIHYVFEVPEPFGYPRWDWSATNDPFNDGATCVEPSDPGCCYRNELGIVEPMDFFTDPEAIKFYKYKLRYLIARYGYSNEIAILEMVSEINNAASKHHIEFLPGQGCYDTGGPGTGRPYDSVSVFPHVINLWHEEMCQYIKEDLQHTNHPLAVSYAGPPDWENGDHSYQSQFVDVMTYNFYQTSIEKHENAVEKVEEWQVDKFINKPFMFSEYGQGQHYLCDQGVDFIKTLALSPFSGAAGAAMNWDWQFPGQEQYWHYMGPVNERMSGIKLDEENWVVGEPIVSANKAVEVLYLRNFVEDNYRAVGVVSNRTYNYHTQATGWPCDSVAQGSDLDQNPIYQDTEAYISTVESQTILIPDMGNEVDYKVNWYNSLTGDPLDAIDITTTTAGDLSLNFPLLTGHSQQPILFFEIFQSDQLSFKSLQDSSHSEGSIVNANQIDTIAFDEWQTNWNFIISPNPTSGFVSVHWYSPAVMGNRWCLSSESGEVLLTGKIDSPDLFLNLNVYSDGVYFFCCTINNKNYAYKIIKE
jgi:hypothetical protein